MAEVFLPTDAIDRALRNDVEVKIVVGENTYLIDAVYGIASFGVVERKGTRVARKRGVRGPRAQFVILDEVNGD